MNFMNKLEKKLGRYAIQNLSLVLIICYGFGYAIQIVNYGFLNYLTLNPYLVLRGQVWRLLTWILVPPTGFNIVFTIYPCTSSIGLGRRWNVPGGLFATICFCLGAFSLLFWAVLYYWLIAISCLVHRLP